MWLMYVCTYISDTVHTCTHTWHTYSVKSSCMYHTWHTCAHETLWLSMELNHDILVVHVCTQTTGTTHVHMYLPANYWSDNSCEIPIASKVGTKDARPGLTSCAPTCICVACTRFHTSYPINSLQRGRFVFVLKFVATCTYMYLIWHLLILDLVKSRWQ